MTKQVIMSICKLQKELKNVYQQTYDNINRYDALNLVILIQNENLKRERDAAKIISCIILDGGYLNKYFPNIKFFFEVVKQMNDLNIYEEYIGESGWEIMLKLSTIDNVIANYDKLKDYIKDGIFKVFMQLDKHLLLKKIFHHHFIPKKMEKKEFCTNISILLNLNLDDNNIINKIIIVDKMFSLIEQNIWVLKKYNKFKKQFQDKIIEFENNSNAVELMKKFAYLKSF